MRYLTTITALLLAVVITAGCSSFKSVKYVKDPDAEYPYQLMVDEGKLKDWTGRDELPIGAIKGATSYSEDGKWYIIGVGIVDPDAVTDDDH